MIPFENIAIIGSGNVAYTYSKVLKDNGINLKYIFVRNQDKISDVENEVSEDKAMSARYRIIRFEDEVRHGTLHTKEHYDQIIVDIDIYEAFCKRNPDFRNNLAHKAISNIKRMYDVHNDDNSFL